MQKGCLSRGATGQEASGNVAQAQSRGGQVWKRLAGVQEGSRRALRAVGGRASEACWQMCASCGEVLERRSWL